MPFEPSLVAVARQKSRTKQQVVRDVIVNFLTRPGSVRIWSLRVLLT